jgi:hypothetical protein
MGWCFLARVVSPLRRMRRNKFLVMGRRKKNLSQIKNPHRKNKKMIKTRIRLNRKPNRRKQ